MSNTHLKRIAKIILNHPLIVKYGKKVAGRTPPPIYDFILKTYLERVYREEYRLGLEGKIYRKAKALGLFDEAYYCSYNHGVSTSGLDPLSHYIKFGRPNFLRTSPKFDHQWYTIQYLDNKIDGIDPVLHYLKKGLSKGYSPLPPHPVKLHSSSSLKALKRPIKRICLFAGYDPHGLIDDYVIDYLEELSKYCDIYYLADNSDMSPEELKKIEPFTKGAWAVKHGRYDFGSYSMLMNKLVGWDTIKKYDELLLTNDSCYLVRPFEEVFNKMEDSTCAWWGLQAAKGLASTFNHQKFPHERPIDLSEIKKNYLEIFDTDYTYDFYMGSYFLAFRGEVINNIKFQKFFEQINVSNNKLLLIRFYEIGLTRLMLFLGYDFDAFCNKVYPRQPIFTDLIFNLIAEGFPLFKKYLLQHNHYGISGLENWKALLRKAGVKKDLNILENNISRTFDNQQFYKNQRVTKSEEGNYIYPQPLNKKQVCDLDPVTPKYDDWWVFPVCFFSHSFADNTRAVFEYVKNDPSIKKIVLTRSKAIHVDGVNVEIFPLHSREGQFYILRSRQIFLKHDLNHDIEYQISEKYHNIINLWHGIPLKRIGYTSLDFLAAEALPRLAENNKKIKAVISASKVDQLSMAASFWPLNYYNIWVTGLPRHDFINCELEALPAELQREYELLETLLDKRRLLLFVPTFRNNQISGYYKFSNQEIARLNAFLKANDMVMGIREHMADYGSSYLSTLRGDNFINVSSNRFNNVEVLYRKAEVLLTDFSSAYIDFLHTGRPVVSFAYDGEQYSSQERGLFYDHQWAFPGKIATTFDELIISLRKAVNGLSEEDKKLYQFKKKTFIDYEDAENSRRVVNHVIELKQNDITYFSHRKVDIEVKKDKKILWVCDYNKKDLLRSRVFSLKPALEKDGWKCKFAFVNDLKMEHFLDTSVVIITRLSATETMLDLCEGFKRNGGKIVVDIGGLVFDEFTAPDNINYEDYSSFMALLRNEYDRMKRCMALSHMCVASSQLSFNKIKNDGYAVTYIPNAIDITITNPNYNSEINNINICYISGIEICEADNIRNLNILERLIKENHTIGIYIHIIGTKSLKPQDEHLSPRFINHGTLSYEAREFLFVNSDILIIPLDIGPFIYYDLEVTLLQAAAHKTPSIVCIEENNFSDFIEDGKNGFTVSSKENMYDKVNAMITSFKLSQEMGLKAQHKIQDKHLPKNVAAQIGKMLKQA